MKGVGKTKKQPPKNAKVQFTPQLTGNRITFGKRKVNLFLRSRTAPAAESPLINCAELASCWAALSLGICRRRFPVAPFQAGIRLPAHGTARPASPAAGSAYQSNAAGLDLSL